MMTFVQFSPMLDLEHMPQNNNNNNIGKPTSLLITHLTSSQPVSLNRWSTTTHSSSNNITRSLPPSSQSPPFTRSYFLSYEQSESAQKEESEEG